MKYCLMGGNIRSRTDGQVHYIRADDLIRLYDLDKNDCILAPSNMQFWKPPTGVLMLYPQESGDYRLPLKEFKVTHNIFNDSNIYTEETAPLWLRKGGVKHSTMDNRWFWNDHIMELKVGEIKETDFHTIERIK